MHTIITNIVNNRKSKCNNKDKYYLNRIITLKNKIFSQISKINKYPNIINQAVINLHFRAIDAIRIKMSTNIKEVLIQNHQIY